MSLLTGRLSVKFASNYRKKVLTAHDLERAAVRYTSVGKLRAAGFAVVHTPGRVTNGCGADGEHVSVIWPVEDPLVRQDIPWPPDVAESFVQCFNGY
ncbi:hypothetical protein [Herbidospora sp. RD11066]